MGLLETAVLESTLIWQGADGQFDARGKTRYLTDLQRERLQAASLAMAAHGAPETFRGISRCVRFNPSRFSEVALMPSGLAADYYPERLNRISLTAREVYGESTHVGIRLDTTVISEICGLLSDR